MEYVHIRRGTDITIHIDISPVQVAVPAYRPVIVNHFKKGNNVLLHESVPSAADNIY